MKLPVNIKKVPRWTWYTAGGLALGYGAIHLYRNRTTAADTSGTDTTSQNSAGYPVLSANQAGVIVPPVVVPDTPADSGSPDLTSAYLGGFQSLIDAFGTITGQLSDQNSAASMGFNQFAQNESALLAMLAGAGSSPNSGATQAVAPIPSPIAQPTPVAAAAPAATPASHCPPDYPNSSSRGCYKVACASGSGSRAKGRWHLYQHGPDVHVSDHC